MPVGGARTVGDLMDGGAERLMISCNKCDRARSYVVSGLVTDHGPMCRLPDLLAYFARRCPWRKEQGIDGCGAAYRPG
jgi:hypothetical protein